MRPRINPSVLSFALAAIVLSLGATPLLAAEAYSIDGAHSFVVFRVNHLGISDSYGRFNEMSGEFQVDGQTPKSLSFQINAESVDSANEDRDKHLRSPDFFNVKQFPVIKFASKSIEKHGDHFEVTGDLTMLGVTKTVTFEARHTGEGKDPWGNYRSGWHGEFTVKRSDFGMNFMLEGIGDEVAVVVAVEGIKK